MNTKTEHPQPGDALARAIEDCLCPDDEFQCWRCEKLRRTLRFITPKFDAEAEFEHWWESEPRPWMTAEFKLQAKVVWIAAMATYRVLGPS